MLITLHDSVFFLYFFLLIDLYLLIPAVIVEIFIPNAELVMPGAPNNEANAEIETTSIDSKNKNKKMFKVT